MFSQKLQDRGERTEGWGKLSFLKEQRRWLDQSISVDDRASSYRQFVDRQLEEVERLMKTSDRGVRAEIRTDPDVRYWLDEAARIVQLTPEEFCRELDQPAVRLMNSWTIDQDGWISVTIPAMLSSIKALEALNEFGRESDIEAGRSDTTTVISALDFEWYAHLSVVRERNVLYPRHIRIKPFVEETLRKPRASQEEVLRDQGMTFASPFDIAVVAGVSACRTPGSDLLQGKIVRGSVSNIALKMTKLHGVNVQWCSPADSHDIAAAGTPLE